MTGLSDPSSIEVSGRLAGLRAAGDCGADIAARLKSVTDEAAALHGPARGSKFIMAPAKGAKTFICFDEDTTVKNVDQASAMGFENDMPELIKGVLPLPRPGPGQGGIPGHNLPLLYLARNTGSPHPRSGRPACGPPWSPG